ARPSASLPSLGGGRSSQRGASRRTRSRTGDRRSRIRGRTRGRPTGRRAKGSPHDLPLDQALASATGVVLGRVQAPHLPYAGNGTLDEVAVRVLPDGQALDVA